MGRPRITPPATEQAKLAALSDEIRAVEHQICVLRERAKKLRADRLNLSRRVYWRGRAHDYRQRAQQFVAVSDDLLVLLRAHHPLPGVRAA